MDRGDDEYNCNLQRGFVLHSIGILPEYFSHKTRLPRTTYYTGLVTYTLFRKLWLPAAKITPRTYAVTPIARHSGDRLTHNAAHSCAFHREYKERPENGQAAIMCADGAAASLTYSMDQVLDMVRPSVSFQ